MRLSQPPLYTGVYQVQAYQAQSPYYYLVYQAPNPHSQDGEVHSLGVWPNHHLAWRGHLLWVSFVHCSPVWLLGDFQALTIVHCWPV